MATAQRAMELAAAKLPIKTKFITRHDQEGGLHMKAKLDKVRMQPSEELINRVMESTSPSFASNSRRRSATSTRLNRFASRRKSWRG